jgi:hypothetical protein
LFLLNAARPDAGQKAATPNSSASLQITVMVALMGLLAVVSPSAMLVA